jgi:hypothetical protein
LTDTKTVEVRGKAYIIKRWTFDEGIALDAFVDEHKDDFKGQQLFIVTLGVVNPKLSTEEWQKEDWETVAKLWYELQEYNRFDTDFLSLLRKSSQQVAQLGNVTSPQ